VSCYDLSRLLFDLKMKDSVYEKALTDFEDVMANYELTAEEKTALRDGDPRKLRQLGVHRRPLRPDDQHVLELRSQPYARWPCYRRRTHDQRR